LRSTPELRPLNPVKRRDNTPSMTVCKPPWAIWRIFIILPFAQT